MEPLLCTKCSRQVTLVEHYIAYLDQGLAMVREDGVVVPVEGSVDDDERTWVGDPVRVMAVCINSACGHQWTLRRRFDFTWLPKEAS